MFKASNIIQGEIVGQVSNRSPRTRDLNLSLQISDIGRTLGEARDNVSRPASYSPDLTHIASKMVAGVDKVIGRNFAASITPEFSSSKWKDIGAIPV